MHILGFDPLGLYTFRSSFNLYVVGQELSREQKLKDAKLDMELCEIKNGRLAMIGITGIDIIDFHIYLYVYTYKHICNIL